jgi:hypothetical protein
VSSFVLGSPHSTIKVRREPKTKVRPADKELKRHAAGDGIGQEWTAAGELSAAEQDRGVQHSVLSSEGNKSAVSLKSNSTERGSYLVDEERAVPKDNETLLRIRVERMERKVLEIQLRTEEDILCMEKDLQQRKARLLENLEDLEAEIYPDIGLNYLASTKVASLHMEGKELRREVKRLEREISEEVDLSHKLIQESLDIQRQTDALLKEIKRADSEQTRHMRTLEALGDEKALLTNVTNSWATFDAHNHDFFANFVPILEDKEYFLLKQSLRNDPVLEARKVSTVMATSQSKLRRSSLKTT